VPQPWAGAHPWGQRTAEREVYRNNIEQIVLADRLGFEAVWLVEHHFRENRSHMPCNEVVLGALSQITERIKLGFGVSLMPHEFIHPARVAEKVATVDLLSRGRAICPAAGRSGAWAARPRWSRSPSASTSPPARTR
jgi:alkanesulfonate monooxygenase SsuD/methylene tetrahydromethanopterin reductase-like flavin-dependent oxidoreductase (luciferase family)